MRCYENDFREYIENWRGKNNDMFNMKQIRFLLSVSAVVFLKIQLFPVH